MDRRSILKKAGLTCLSIFLGYPLYRFIKAESYRPPRRVIINEKLEPGQNLMKSDFAFFMTEKGGVAVSRICTHLGCIINYDEKQKIFICPCHQSKFTWDGRRIAGPAKKDLPLHQVETLENNKGYLIIIA